ncbi:MAG: hypothetical protein C0169_06165, partial [Thermodesulfobacterium geofontis]
MRLSECLDEIFALGGKINQPDKYGLANIKRVLLMLGNPENKVPYFHITGTKGKGSTSNYIASILREHGYKTGLYISPSLISTLERISINGKLITPLEFVKYYESLKPIYKNLKNDELPSTFETFTIMAFLYFLSKNVDYGVLEVGLGGRLDATNVIERSVVSIITDISFDHQKYLGNTLKETISDLQKENLILKKGDKHFFNGRKSPAPQVNLRSSGEENIKLIDLEKNTILERISKNRALEEAFLGAVYLHLGETYLVKKMDLENKEIYLKKEMTDYYTDSLAIETILIDNILKEKNVFKVKAYFGEVTVEEVIRGFVKKQFFTDRKIETLPLELPKIDFKTKALWITIDNNITEKIKKIDDFLGAIHAAEHAMVGILPLI